MRDSFVDLPVSKDDPKILGLLSKVSQPRNAEPSS